MGRKSKYCVFHSLEGSGAQNRNGVICGTTLEEAQQDEEVRQKLHLLCPAYLNYGKSSPAQAKELKTIQDRATKLGYRHLFTLRKLYSVHQNTNWDWNSSNHQLRDSLESLDRDDVPRNMGEDHLTDSSSSTSSHTDQYTGGNSSDYTPHNSNTNANSNRRRQQLVQLQMPMAPVQSMQLQHSYIQQMNPQQQQQQQQQPQPQLIQNQYVHPQQYQPQNQPGIPQQNQQQQQQNQSQQQIPPQQIIQNVPQNQQQQAQPILQTQALQTLQTQPLQQLQQPNQQQQQSPTQNQTQQQNQQQPQYQQIQMPIQPVAISHPQTYIPNNYAELQSYAEGTPHTTDPNVFTQSAVFPAAYHDFTSDSASSSKQINSPPYNPQVSGSLLDSPSVSRVPSFGFPDFKGFGRSGQQSGNFVFDSTMSGSSSKLMRVPSFGLPEVHSSSQGDVRISSMPNTFIGRT